MGNHAATGAADIYTNTALGGTTAYAGANIIGSTLFQVGGASVTGIATADVFLTTAEVLADTNGDGEGDTGTGIFAGAAGSNGGDVRTLALLPGGRAVDAGSNADLPPDSFDLDDDGSDTEPLPQDARRENRIGNGVVDLGAFEVDGSVTTGTPGPDSLLGTTSADSIVALEGNDQISSDDGDDTVDAGPGIDLVFAGAGSDSVDGGEGIDAISGGADGDILIGGDGNDILFGDGGGDALYGGADDDVLAGGESADSLFGGLGSDTASHVTAGGPVTADLQTPGNNTGEASGDSYDSIENLTGALGFANTLTGDGAANRLRGGNQDDLLSGGGEADTLLGLSGDDTLRGGDADDLLDGGAGADLMEGGAGDDIYIADNAGDTIVELVGEGYDRVRTTASIILGAHVDAADAAGSGDLDISGADGANWIRGNAGRNTLSGGSDDDRLDGRDGDDRLIGGLGNDVLEGGAGSDIFEVALGDGTDLVLDFEIGTDQIDLTPTALGFENLIISDSVLGASVNYGFNGASGTLILAGVTAAQLSSADFIAAPSGTPVISGTSGSDVLDGTNGADDLRGLGGDDLIRGNAGADTMTGGTGDDRYLVDDSGDLIVELAGEGYDRVYTSVSITLAGEVEALNATGSANLNLAGNGADNWITGNPGANAISGADGNDRLRGLDGDDTLTGGVGNDVLEGGGGADRFVFGTGDGLDLVLDFEIGTDLADLSSTGLSFADLTVTDITSGALIAYGADALVLSGIAATDVVEGMFAFTP